MIAMCVAGVIGGTGLACIISRSTFLGFMIGVQLLILGGTMIFVLAGISSGSRVEGHIVGLFIVFGGVAQLTAGMALAIRLFHLKKRARMGDLRELKQ